MLLLLLAASALSSCATQKEPEPLIKQDGDQVSTIPWNKPQSWEGQGQLGGLQDQAQHR